MDWMGLFLGRIEEAMEGFGDSLSLNHSSFRARFVRIVWMMPFRSFLLRHPWGRVLVASGVVVEQERDPCESKGGARHWMSETLMIWRWSLFEFGSKNVGVISTKET